MTDGPSRHRLLFEQLQDAVVDFELEDGEPVVREVNPAFESVFGYDAAAVRGERLNDLIVPAVHDEESTTFDRQTGRGERSAAVVRRRTADGVRTFLYRGIPYDGGDRGFAVYTDVSDELRAEQRLALLERVLRHNVRNEVTLVRGRARQLLEDASDRQRAARAEEILAAASRLTRLADEAREIEQLLDHEAWTARSPAALVEGALVATDLRERAGTIEVDVGDAPRIRDAGALQAALEALLDNAVRHNDAAEPWVRVATAVDDGAVALRVADDGPGIPAAERDVLGGSCPETPLDHGSGLGLWLVHFATQAAGGRVAVHDREPRGTEVVLLLPVAP